MGVPDVERDPNLITYRYRRYKKPAKSANRKIPVLHPLHSHQPLNDKTASFNVYSFYLRALLRKFILKRNYTHALFPKLLRIAVFALSGKIGTFGQVAVRNPIRLIGFWKLGLQLLKHRGDDKLLILFMDRFVEAASAYNSRMEYALREKIMTEEYLSEYFNAHFRLARYDDAYTKLSGQISLLPFSENPLMNGYAGYAAYKLWKEQVEMFQEPSLDSIHLSNAIAHFHRCFDLSPPLNNSMISFLKIYIECLEANDPDRVLGLIEKTMVNFPNEMILLRIHLDLSRKYCVDDIQKGKLALKILEIDPYDSDAYKTLTEIYSPNQEVQILLIQATILRLKYSVQVEDAWHNLANIISTFDMSHSKIDDIKQEILSFPISNVMYIHELACRIILSSKPNYYITIFCDRNNRSQLSDAERSQLKELGINISNIS